MTPIILCRILRAYIFLYASTNSRKTTILNFVKINQLCNYLCIVSELIDLNLSLHNRFIERIHLRVKLAISKLSERHPIFYLNSQLKIVFPKHKPMDFPILSSPVFLFL